MKGFSIRFKRENENILTFGVDYEAPVRSVFRQGNWEVWHKRSATNWAGVGFRATSPSLWMLGKLSQDKDGDMWFLVVDEREPGHNWRKAKEELISLAQRMELNEG